MQCEIIEAAHIEDAIGYHCSNDSVAKCLDCGITVCDAHAESCGFCDATFCATCLAFHNREQHQKKPARAPMRQRRKSALRPMSVLPVALLSYLGESGISLRRKCSPEKPSSSRTAGGFSMGLSAVRRSPASPKLDSAKDSRISKHSPPALRP